MIIKLLILLSSLSFGKCEEYEKPLAAVVKYLKRNSSEMAIALAEISRGIATTKTITLLNTDNRRSSAFNEFIMEIHRLKLETCTFNDREKFFHFVESNLKGSLEVTALIFHDPNELIDEVKSMTFSSRFNFVIFHRFTVEI